jgi:hypothetical protein
MWQGEHSKLCTSGNPPSLGEVRVCFIGLSQLMHLGAVDLRGSSMDHPALFLTNSLATNSLAIYYWSSMNDSGYGCESARGPDADRHPKLLIHLAWKGSLFGAFSQAERLCVVPEPASARKRRIVAMSQPLNLLN